MLIAWNCEHRKIIESEVKENINAANQHEVSIRLISSKLSSRLKIIEPVF
jgi:hypothetical protein